MPSLSTTGLPELPPTMSAVQTKSKGVSALICFSALTQAGESWCPLKMCRPGLGDRETAFLLNLCHRHAVVGPHALVRPRRRHAENTRKS